MWSFWKRKQRERDLDDEIAHDLALNAEERVHEGASREEAVHASRRDFGNLALVKEETRRVWGWMWLEVLVQDLRYAARTLRKSPAFAATAIVALALGIGVNTACFTIFDQVAFRPLPIPDGDRIVAISESFHGRFSRTMHGNLHLLSYPELVYYAEHNRVFMHMAAFAAAKGLALDGTPPEIVFGYLVSGDYFRMLSGRAAAGRMLLPEDSAAPNAVAVLSYAFWQRRFGGDPAVVGTIIRLNQTPLTVVGVNGGGLSRDRCQDSGRLAAARDAAGGDAGGGSRTARLPNGGTVCLAEHGGQVGARRHRAAGSGGSRRLGCANGQEFPRPNHGSECRNGYTLRQSGGADHLAHSGRGDAPGCGAGAAGSVRECGKPAVGARRG
jgi:hypothetical protein